MSGLRKSLLRIFDIPAWYEHMMSSEEEKKLIKYVMEASCVMEARLYRILDCSAFCMEKFCFFCTYPNFVKKN